MWPQLPGHEQGGHPGAGSTRGQGLQGVASLGVGWPLAPCPQHVQRLPPKRVLSKYLPIK